MSKHTALNQAHRDLDARMVDFAGWDMPLHYGSQIAEHHAVRKAAGMFDVSHMRVLDLHGSDAKAFLQYLLANDVAKLKADGKALYSCMLNEAGGVIDDLIVYFVEKNWYRLVVNSATATTDLAWIIEQARQYSVEVFLRDHLSIIAIQGPKAIERAISTMSTSLSEKARTLKLFSSIWDANWFVARTGYTGEDGFEIILPNSEAPALWAALIKAGVKPCGLGARDSLRLEAGMNLYGQDMDERASPLVSGLGWTVAFDPVERQFIGRKALEAQKDQGITHKLIGLVLEGRGVLRSHQKVFNGDITVGEITSGGFSPTLKRSIALARIESSATDQLTVNIRGKHLPVQRVKYPFVRYGKSLLPDG